MARPTLNTSEEALAQLYAETAIDIGRDPFVLFSHDVAFRCARYLTLDKLERRARDKGLPQAASLLPTDDYGFRGVGRSIWRAAQAAIEAKHGQKGLLLDALAAVLDPLRAGGALPRPESGVDHATLPARTFVMSLGYLRRATSQPELSPAQLYWLCWGLGLTEEYARDDYGHLKLHHWATLVRDVQAITFDPANHAACQLESYYLAAATSDLIRLRSPGRPPTGADLAAFVRETELTRPHPPFAARPAGAQTH